MPTWKSDAELAEHYGVHRTTIWNWVKAKRIQSPIRISPGTTRFDLDAIDAKLLGSARARKAQRS